MSEDILLFVKWWNNTYPIDYWWRKKHGVAFNSPAHQQQCVIDMKIEYEEDKIYARLQEEDWEKQLREKEGKVGYRPGYGELFIKQNLTTVSKEEQMATFNKIDIDEIEVSEDGKITIPE